MIPCSREKQKALLEDFLQGTTPDARVNVECFWLEGGVLHVLATSKSLMLRESGSIQIALEVRPDGTG